MKNIELKVKITAFPIVVKALQMLGAKKIKVMKQIDTYYKINNGRLKFREVDDGKFELVQYFRKNTAHSKTSDYQVINFSNSIAQQLQRIFINSCGIDVVVRKKRELWMYGATRIHLDTVAGLGNFLELETVIGKRKLKYYQQEHQFVIDQLHVNKYKKVAVSYSDLLRRK